MTIYALPTLLVYLFSIGSVLLLVILIWTAQSRLASWEERSKRRSKKVVDDYYEQEESSKSKLEHSAISSQLMKRWRSGLRNYDDI